MVPNLRLPCQPHDAAANCTRTMEVVSVVTIFASIVSFCIFRLIYVLPGYGLWKIPPRSRTRATMLAILGSGTILICLRFSSLRVCHFREGISRTYVFFATHAHRTQKHTGGHTAEMIQLLNILNLEKFRPLHIAYARSDSRSRDRAVLELPVRRNSRVVRSKAAPTPTPLTSNAYI